MLFPVIQIRYRDIVSYAAVTGKEEKIDKKEKIK
jgi:hypothetical protein